MLYDKSNAEILSEYNERVYGHEEAKKALICLVARSRMRYFGSVSSMEPSKILLIGGSGTGKTFLVDQLSKMLDFPLLCIDATQMSPGTGRNGITKQTCQLLCKDTVREWVECHYNETEESGRNQLVVFVDEVDKLACSFESSGNWNKHIQNSFLSMFDDYSEGTSFIFSGAFSGLQTKVVKHSLGFNSLEKEEETLLDEAIVKYGLIPEFVGRLTSIVKLDEFGDREYRHLLNHVLLPKKQESLACFNGASLNLSSDDIDAMVKKALNSGQGVRYLKRQLDMLALEEEFGYEKTI